MSNSIGTLMQESQHRAIKVIAYALGLLVYLGGILYAESRAYSLFTKTIDAELLPVALIGIVALGLTAIAAPLAHHFGTSPGVQRIFLDVFYAFDIFAMGANAVLDAALHDVNTLTSILSFWKLYVLPSLPLICLLGWAIFFMLDPSHRKRDTILAARQATEEVLTSRVIEQMKATDLTDIVDQAARESAREIVGQTLGSTPPQVRASTTIATLPITPDVTKKFSRNGRKQEPVETNDPNA
jgi:hypothetical protein